MHYRYLLRFCLQGVILLCIGNIIRLLRLICFNIIKRLQYTLPFLNPEPIVKNTGHLEEYGEKHGHN